MHNYLTLLLLFVTSSVFSQSRIEVVIPSAEAEAQYIWMTLQDLPFFQQNNYQISLPESPLMEDLKDKALKRSLSDDDFSTFKSYFEAEVYNRDQYQQGYNRVEEQLPLLNGFVKQIDRAKKDWQFKSFPSYRVLLTLYGPGGSYNPEIGQVLLYTTPQGGFKQYKNPANTIIHEIVHIGIEESIVQHYQLSHQFKERVVDQYVLLSFGKKLPQYRLQNMGETRIDTYLKNKKSLRYLNQHIEQLLK
ncbi:MAG: hypothetical protein AAF705_19575 [Bacteroidota bacterium]